MPKSAKKKKDKVADFSKAKLKLGKGKATPTNAIDTSFKARSIALPSQSIATEKDGSQPITKRQLTFNDLISHLRHYNSGTRKDALIGLRELFDSNWELLGSSLTPLVNAVVRLVGDEDASVRKQLLLFMAWLLPRIPQEDLTPHSPSLLLFTTSAQTHIFPEIRIDAIKFLDVLLECIPDSVIGGWSEKGETHGSLVLGGYLGVLNAGTRYGEADGPLKATSTASVVLTPASKLVVLRSLSTFLQKALSSLEVTSSNQKGKAPITSSTNLEALFMKNAFSSIEGFYAFESLIEPTMQSARKSVFLTWKPEVSPDDDFGDLFTQDFPLLKTSEEAWTLRDLELVQDASGMNVNLQRPHNASVEFVQRLANTLHSTIIETYLDYAPSVFSPGSTPSETEVQLILNIVRITQTLYHTIFQSPENVDHEHLVHLESIVNYMAPYFPASTRDNKLDQSYEEFNLIFCELSSLVVTASQIESSSLNQKRSSQHRATGGSKSRGPIQTERVTQYITRRLGGESVASSSQISVPINPTAYRALLPTIWALIGSSDTLTDESSEVVHAVLDHAIKISSKSSCKRLTVEFVGRLMLLGLEPHYHGVLSLDKNAGLRGQFDAWFEHLPQVLWELGATNLPTTEITLRVLLRVLQRRPKKAQTETITSLQSRLIPFFYMDHPTRGAVPGPYKKLPVLSASRVRALVLDVVCTILALGKQEGQEFEGLLKAVGLAVAGEDEESYWTHVSSVPMNK